MYYSSGNYEAFARPKKPAGVDRKSAYLVGTGLAALTAACYLVRDGQMKGEHIHLFEKGSIPGGACDGCQYPGIGYVMRGGREMDDHFEVMWDLFRSIPSLETEGASVLDEYYWLNKADPNYSLCRATENRGQNAHTDGKFGLSDQGCMELIKLFLPRMSSSMISASPMSLTRRCSLPTSGSIGAPCSPLRTGTAHWK